MRLLLVAVALSLAGSAAAPAQTSRTADMPVFTANRDAPNECPPISRFHASRQGGKAMLRKLNDLPPADTYAAVYRNVRGCEVPIVIRYGVQQSAGR